MPFRSPKRTLINAICVRKVGGFSLERKVADETVQHRSTSGRKGINANFVSDYRCEDINVEVQSTDSNRLTAMMLFRKWKKNRYYAVNRKRDHKNDLWISMDMRCRSAIYNELYYGIKNGYANIKLAVDSTDSSKRVCEVIYHFWFFRLKYSEDELEKMNALSAHVSDFFDDRRHNVEDKFLAG